MANLRQFPSTQRSVAPAGAFRRDRSKDNVIYQVIVTEPFGYPIYPASGGGIIGPEFSDLRTEAMVYDSRDNRTMKIAFFNVIAKMHFGENAVCRVEEVAA